MKSQNLKDDESIRDNDILIRGINKEHHVFFDENEKCERITSKAFNPSSENFGLSIYVEKLILENDIDPKKYIEDLRKYDGAVYLYAGDIRQIDRMVVQKTPLDDNPYHGEIFYVDNGNAKNFTKSVIRRLRRIAKWYIAILGVNC